MRQRLIAIVITIGLLGGWQLPLQAQKYEEIEDQSSLSIRTTSLEGRKTAKLRLSNGLEAYLISDPNANESAAALSVNVGSWSDPDDAPGLAHFCEHMLFLGTSKYPVESSYHRFVKDHGGITNAYTTTDHTNYMFTVNNDAFEEALDRFSWFFKEPLFNPSGVDRELRAIESEYSTHLDQDGSRRIHVIKQLASPEHPFNRFTIGNLSTLGKVSQKTLREWYDEHYSANLMHLAVYSPLPIERLKTLVAEDFSGIQDKAKEPLKLHTPALPSTLHGSMVHIAPVKDTRSLSLMWELGEDFARRFETQPGNLVAFVLGHEGEQSLLAELKRQNLAEGLSAGGMELANNSYLFVLEVTLTETGLHNVNNVVDTIFSAIAQLRHEGIPSYVFDEERRMGTIHYEYQERENPFSMVSGHTRALILEPIETYPERTIRAERFDPELAQQLVEQLRPEKAIYSLIALPELTKIDLDRQEPWLGSRYTVKPLGRNLLRSWANATPHRRIHLPPANPFVPEQLELVDASDVQLASNDILVRPTLLFDDPEHGQLYYATDDRYGVPEVDWILNIKTPEIEPGDAEKVVLADLYVRAVTEELNAYAYAAQLAGLKFKIERGDNGILIAISGYSENAKELLDAILATLRTVQPDQQKFLTYKKSLTRRYLNFKKESPLTLASEAMRSVVFRYFVSASQKAKAIRKVNYETFLTYRNNLFDRSYLEAMLYGNMTAAEAEQIWAGYRRHLDSLPYPKNEQTQQEVVLLPPDQGPYILEKNTKQTGNAVLLAIQNGEYTFKSRAIQQTLGRLLDEPFFSELRTKQQTGYIVYSAAQELERQLFTFFAVQSASHNTRDLLARFEQFIEGMLQEMNNDPSIKERFETIRSAMIEQLSQPPKNSEEMAATLNLLAFKYDADFDWLDKRIRAFENLSFDQFYTMAKEYLGRANRKRLAVFIKGEIDQTGSLHYRRLRNAKQLRDVSDYVPAAVDPRL